MKGKSIAVQVFAFLIAAVGAYGALFTAGVQAWLGVVAFALTMIMNSPFLSTGTWPQGWSNVMWITNVCGVIIQIGNYLGDHALVDPLIINYIIIGINLFLTTFIKNYGGSTTLA